MPKLMPWAQKSLLWKLNNGARGPLGANPKNGAVGMRVELTRQVDRVSRPLDTGPINEGVAHKDAQVVRDLIAGVDTHFRDDRKLVSRVVADVTRKSQQVTGDDDGRPARPR